MPVNGLLLLGVVLGVCGGLGVGVVVVFVVIIGKGMSVEVGRFAGADCSMVDLKKEKE